MADDIFARLAECTGFDWDSGNVPKLESRHKVTAGECEQVFFQEPLLVAPDHEHSKSEERWATLGRSQDGRALAIIFTIREDRIRVLSARDMNRKERRLYAQTEAEGDS